MRIIFTIYAINSAFVCFLLTFALAFLPDPWIHRVAMKTFTYVYMVFGPVLLILCCYGVVFIKNILFECEPLRIGDNINFMNIFLLFACCCLSSTITLFFSMHKTVEYAQRTLSDERSPYYQLF